MKETTLNEYEKAVNKVVDYINQHLFDSPDIKKLSEIANLSEFHFHRIFKTIIGENIGEYISRLRLEYIAERLQMSDYSLEDIAIRTGYATKHALSKAFKKHFGVSPSVFRAQPKDSRYNFFEENKREIMPLIPEIRIVEAKKVVYIRIIDWYGSPESYVVAWKKLGNFARENNLVNEQTEFIGLSFDNPMITLPENCRFYACFTTQEDVEATGPFGIQIIDGGEYAVFTLKGSYSQLLDIYYNIFLLWLPSSEYKLRKGYSFEKYLNNPGKVSEEDLLTEIYVPVINKTKNNYHGYYYPKRK
ncbi:MAG: AraC family transcriptional regulator [Dysgonomonas sp.]|nr:AraC family transcriptional regulator [Dysgonomonas sp.]